MKYTLSILFLLFALFSLTAQVKVECVIGEIEQATSYLDATFSGLIFTQSGKETARISEPYEVEKSGDYVTFVTKSSDHFYPNAEYKVRFDRLRKQDGKLFSDFQALIDNLFCSGSSGGSSENLFTADLSLLENRVHDLSDNELKIQGGDFIAENNNRSLFNGTINWTNPSGELVPIDGAGSLKYDTSSFNLVGLFSSGDGKYSNVSLVTDWANFQNLIEVSSSEINISGSSNIEDEENASFSSIRITNGNLNIFTIPSTTPSGVGLEKVEGTDRFALISEAIKYTYTPASAPSGVISINFEQTPYEAIEINPQSQALSLSGISVPPDNYSLKIINIGAADITLIQNDAQIQSEAFLSNKTISPGCMTEIHYSSEIGGWIVSK